MIRAGALLLTLLVPISGSAATPVDWSRAQAITMREVEYRFIPDTLILQQGVPYRLHIENRGKELHEFTAPDFIKTLQIRNPEALNADHAEVVVRPGKSKDLYFVPTEAGQFGFICADHDWAGMTGSITVK